MMQVIEVMESRNIDELVILDVDATLHGRKPCYEKYPQYTERLFCPVTVGGGITDIDDIRQLLLRGADKVIVGSVIHTNGGFLSEAAKKFGSQCITVALDVYMDKLSKNSAKFVCNNLDVVESAKIAEDKGAGEILLTSVLDNGLMEGYNYELIDKVSEAVSIPVVAHGGCGEPEHMGLAFDAGADAVAASSMFLFTEYTPRDCVEFLYKKGYKVRYDNDSTVNKNTSKKRST